jgi:TetR/AcrR family transcriptional regulator, tetracycline repressor protein
MSGAPRGRGGRPALITKDDVVAAAIALVDAEGLDALTMRAVGARLGVAAMSLYRHLPGRDAVLAAVVNRLVSEVAVDLPADAGWPDALRAFALGYRAMLLRHPHAVPLLATQPVDVDTGMALAAPVLDRSRAAGIGQDDAVTALQSVTVFVLGHALAQVGTPPGAEDPPPAAPADYYDRWFAAGLNAMIEGFTRTP